MSEESLKDELKPFYQKGDCCSWIVELRKDKYQLQQENKQLKDGLHKILDLNKRAINCDSQKVTIKYLLKQYDLIYETLGELQPGLMKGNKE